VGRIFLHHGFAEVKGNKFYAQVFGVEALYQGVVPVNLVHHVVNALGYFFAGVFGIFQFANF
jgi:hypothetical protein